jgi:hypothetical protein
MRKFDKVLVDPKFGFSRLLFTDIKFWESSGSHGGEYEGDSTLENSVL